MRIIRLAVDGALPIFLRFPASSSSGGAEMCIVLGPNGAGKTLLVRALQTAMAPDPERERLCAELSAREVTCVEVDCEQGDWVSRLVCRMEYGECELHWEKAHLSPDEILNHPHYSNHAQHADSAISPPAEDHSELFPLMHMVSAGRLALPEDYDVSAAIERMMRRPLERELAGWQARLTYLCGEDGQGGKRQTLHDEVESAKSELERVEQLWKEIETAVQKRQELEARINRTFAQGQIHVAEAAELERIWSLAERAVRIDNWINEIRVDQHDVHGLREQHAELLSRLDELERRFRGVPDDFSEILERYTACVERERILVGEFERLAADLGRTASDLEDVERQIRGLVAPEQGESERHAAELNREAEELNDELTALLRGRIERVRLREGLRQQLQRDGAAFADLSADQRAELEQAVKQGGFPRTSEPQAMSDDSERRERRVKLDAVRGQIAKKCAGYPAPGMMMVERVSDLHDLRRLQNNLKSDLQGLRNRGEQLKPRAHPSRSLIAAIVIAVLTFAAVSYWISWDFAFFAAAVTSGLTFLLFRYIYRKVLLEIDSVSAAEMMTMRKREETTTAISRLERELGPLAACATPDEALENYREYGRLCVERDRLEAAEEKWLRAQAAAPRETRTGEAGMLPLMLMRMPFAEVESSYLAYCALEGKLGEIEREAAEYEEGGVRALRIAELEERLARVQSELSASSTRSAEERKSFDARQTELQHRRALLENALSERESLIRIERELGDLREQIAAIHSATGGMLRGMDLDLARAEWREREALRNRLRETRNLLSARQTFDELRAREALLCEEAAQVRQRISSLDPLYLLQGTAAEYAMKYSGQLNNVRDTMLSEETARRELQQELDSIRPMEMEERMAGEPALDQLRVTLKVAEERLQNTERDLTTTRDLIASIESELREIGEECDTRLRIGIAEKLKHLSLGRMIAAERDDEGWIVTLADGSTRRMNALSDGTCDLIWLAIRLGVLEAAKECDNDPLIWDEALARLDDAHLERVRESLAYCSTQRQVILLTRHGAFESWGHAQRLVTESEWTPAAL